MAWSAIDSSCVFSRISFCTYFVEPVMRVITASGEKTVCMNGASPPSSRAMILEAFDLLAVRALRDVQRLDVVQMLRGTDAGLCQNRLAPGSAAWTYFAPQSSA